MTWPQDAWTGPQLYVSPGAAHRLGALTQRWGLMLALQTMGFENAVRLSRRYGRFIWKHVPLMNRQVRDTIAVALRQSHSAEEIERIAERYTTDMWLGFIETEYMFRYLSGAVGQRFVRLRGVQRLIETVRGGRGVVAAGIYFGNHQAGLTALGHALAGRVAGIVSARQYGVQQRWMAGLVKRRLVQLYPRGDAVRQATRALRAGNVVSIMTEHASRRGAAVAVEFLGQERHFHPTAALLSFRTGCPLAVLTCRRAAPAFDFELELHDWIEPPSSGRREWVRRTTIRVMKRFDAVVRACPEQYAWARRHQAFVHDES